MRQQLLYQSAAAPAMYRQPFRYPQAADIVYGLNESSGCPIGLPTRGRPHDLPARIDVWPEVRVVRPVRFPDLERKAAQPVITCLIPFLPDQWRTDGITVWSGPAAETEPSTGIFLRGTHALYDPVQRDR